VADTIPGTITSRLSELAKQHSLHIIAGILERRQKALYDSAVLISCTRKIVLRYRRINPRWHERNADKDLYRQGEQFGTASLPFGKVGVIICGDFFDNSVLKMVKEAKPDVLVVPVALFDSSYGNSTPEKWATYKREWINQAKNLGITCILVNSISGKEKSDHSAGALIVSGTGELLTEAEIGKETIIYYELPYL
jgi:predicted amidohydrolase